MKTIFICSNNHRQPSTGKTWLATAALFGSLLAGMTNSSLLTAAEPSAKARQLALSNLIVDTHIDVPFRLEMHWEDMSQGTEGGDFDYPRAVSGGLNAPFMSIFIPASYEESGGGDKLANHLIDYVEAMVGRAPDKFQLAYTVADVENAFANKRIALPMGMENGTPIAGSFEKLQHFYNRGIRYITLTHSQSNHIADSSYSEKRQWNGLSPFGKKLIAEMNRLGIMVDISHVSDEAFYQALDISKTPIIASHSSLRKFTPGFERNMSDDMLKAMAKKGGVIQINFSSLFITEQANNWKKGLDKVMEHQKFDTPDQEMAFFMEYMKKNPVPFASLDQLLDHFDHVKNLVGIDHIGIGSDFDGAGDSLPENLKNVSAYPNLIQGLLDRGYNEEDIAKITHGNIFRVWREVEKFATSTP